MYLNVSQHTLAVHQQKRSRDTLLRLSAATHIPPRVKQADTRRVVHKQRHTAVLPVIRGGCGGDPAPAPAAAATDLRQERHRSEKKRSSGKLL